MEGGFFNVANAVYFRGACFPYLREILGKKSLFTRQSRFVRAFHGRGWEKNKRRLVANKWQ
ncbi:MAG: hypothetical protein DBX55_08135 [Verrucomicrobia bacterium]|nr:MAG: hypothetical protein DBX55_08135 [Verrucomicrobiota bacterium]